MGLNEIQWILHDQGSTIVPVFRNRVHGISDKIDTGDDILGSHPLDTYHALKKWSFKAQVDCNEQNHHHANTTDES